MTVCVNSRWN